MARRLSLILTLVGLLLALAVTPALGAIHPITSGDCAAANGSDVANGQNPVGQFKGGLAVEEAFFDGEVAATGSFLRAVIATGVVLVDENGFFAGFDITRGALNGGSGAEKCPNA